MLAIAGGHAKRIGAKRIVMDALEAMQPDSPVIRHQGERASDMDMHNADAAEKALLSFRDIFWIAGGKAKEGGIAPLAP